MPSGDELGVDRVGVFQQLAELELNVAHHAGVGRPGAGVLVDEVVDDAVEFPLEIQRVKRDAEPAGNRAGVERVGDRTAAVLQATLCFSVRAIRLRHVRPDAHENADAVVALLLEQTGRDGRIHAAGHRHDDPATSRHDVSSIAAGGARSNRGQVAGGDRVRVAWRGTLC